MSPKAVASSQLSWLDIVEPVDGDDLTAKPERIFVPVYSHVFEPKEEFELRRVGLMAKKLGFPALQLPPVRDWTGITIPQGEEAWLEILGQKPSEIGLIMLALHDQLQPLIPGCIDTTGLYDKPAEVISQHEEKQRSYMLNLAEHLEWPRISYYVAHELRVFGTGEDAWRMYSVYGCAGLVGDAICALERRLSGEPDRVKQPTRQQVQDDDDE